MLFYSGEILLYQTPIESLLYPANVLLRQEENVNLESVRQVRNVSNYFVVMKLLKSMYRLTSQHTKGGAIICIEGCASNYKSDGN